MRSGPEYESLEYLLLTVYLLLDSIYDSILEATVLVVLKIKYQERAHMKKWNCVLAAQNAFAGQKMLARIFSHCKLDKPEKLAKLG